MRTASWKIYFCPWKNIYISAKMLMKCRGISSICMCTCPWQIYFSVIDRYVLSVPQLLKVAFDEEVNSDDVETLRKLVNKVRNPLSVMNTFAFTGVVVAQPSQHAKHKEKNASLKWVPSLGDACQCGKMVTLLKLKLSQYPSIHTNYIITHCTTL